jgi:dTDP-4-dehydrorhamnose 3,5-epimerase
MSIAIESLAIDGVRLVRPQAHADARGWFFEGFRASWFGPQQRWVQWNVSRSVAGVLRGLHFHRLQTDFWIAVDGRILAGLYDLRPGSPTQGRGMCVELSGAQPGGLLIPPGIAHGYRALTDATLMYLLDQEYSGSDEYALRWDDPALGMPAAWLAEPPPVISARDAAAPSLAALRAGTK